MGVYDGYDGYNLTPQFSATVHRRSTGKSHFGFKPHHLQSPDFQFLGTNKFSQATNQSNLIITV